LKSPTSRRNANNRAKAQRSKKKRPRIWFSI
jgi:hypothetical protein